MRKTTTKMRLKPIVGRQSLLKMVGIRSTKPKPASPLVRPPSQSEIDYEQDREMIIEQITKTNLHYGTLIGDNIPSLTELMLQFQVEIEE